MSSKFCLSTLSKGMAIFPLVPMSSTFIFLSACISTNDTIDAMEVGVKSMRSVLPEASVQE